MWQDDRTFVEPFAHAVQTDVMGNVVAVLNPGVVLDELVRPSLREHDSLVRVCIGPPASREHHALYARLRPFL
jgi:hypothetical protein